jgi:site-specific DNA-cytosine methylase
MNADLSTLLDALQTIAILITLLFSLWQWKKTRDTIKIDNFAKIIEAMNTLRDYRLATPDVERALFESRKDWSDAQIRKRVYGVMFANIFEWTLFSRQGKLIDEKQWKSWEDTIKTVILTDRSFAELLTDKSIYTFSFEARDMIKKWVEEIHANGK